MIKIRSNDVDVDKAHYIYQKLRHCIENDYQESALQYLDELVDIMSGEDK